MGNNTIFGTDGIRGLVNKYPVTPQNMIFIGKGIAKYLLKHHDNPKILIGMDPRESSMMIKYSLISGILSEGVSVYDSDVVSTPMIALYTQKHNFDFGIIVSASHNSHEYNGIKIFNSKGRKLSLEEENVLENFFLPSCATPVGCSVSHEIDIITYYSDYMFDTIGDSLADMKIVLDCANGSYSNIAKAIIERCGGCVIQEIASQPNGKNINDNVGACHTGLLSQTVLDSNADIGIAFDGDGDRLIIVDDKGIVVDGDQIIAFLCKNMNNVKSVVKSVVGTILTNTALENYLNNINITLHRSDVGDKAIADTMIKTESIIGGEPSGHIILSDYMYTGDGLFIALSVMKNIRILKYVNNTLKVSDIFPIFNAMPVITKNVNKFANITAIKEKAKQYINDCKIITRESGTESVIRIIIEGNDLEIIQKIAEEIVNTI